MPYTKQTWSNGTAGGSPLSAARLNYIEDGIATAQSTAEAASGAAAFKFVRRVSTDIAVTSTTWIDLDATLDLTLAAAVGDVIEAFFQGEWNNEARFGYLDAATIVAGSPVNVMSTGTTESPTGGGIASWGTTQASVYIPASGSVFYTIVSGDLSAGQVTMRLRVRIDAAGTKTLFANANTPLSWAIKNLGPAAA